MAVTQRHLTLEEFLALPEEKPALEFENGEVTQKVPPSGRHSLLQLWICQRINERTRPEKVALALPELRTTYAGRSRVPDVAVYRWNRVPVTEAGEIADEFRLPPDIAIEIVSPGQTANQMVTRSLWYTENGVHAALLVDPSHRSVLVFRPNQPPVSLTGSDIIDLTNIVLGLTLSVSELFESLII